MQTRNSLPEKARLEVAALLQSALADSIGLMMQARQTHSNVKGPNFTALHELFHKVLVGSEKYVDVIAGRMVQLGGIAQESVRATAKKSRLPDHTLDISSSRNQVTELARMIAFYGRQIRETIENSHRPKDADKADTFTAVSRGADRNLCFVEAHEQEAC